MVIEGRRCLGFVTRHRSSSAESARLPSDASLFSPYSSASTAARSSPRLSLEYPRMPLSRARRISWSRVIVRTSNLRSQSEISAPIARRSRARRSLSRRRQQNGRQAALAAAIAAPQRQAQPRAERHRRRARGGRHGGHDARRRHARGGGVLELHEHEARRADVVAEEQPAERREEERREQPREMHGRQQSLLCARLAGRRVPGLQGCSWRLRPPLRKDRRVSASSPSGEACQSAVSKRSVAKRQLCLLLR